MQTAQFFFLKDDYEYFIDLLNHIPMLSFEVSEKQTNTGTGVTYFAHDTQTLEVIRAYYYLFISKNKQNASF